jgi:hypothetical protein
MGQQGTQPSASEASTGEAEAFEKELYRDPGDGHEKWRIRELGTGAVMRDGIESDHDAQWVLDVMNHGEGYADEQEDARRAQRDQAEARLAGHL